MTPIEPFRILWHSNAPHAPTGYGNQTALFTPKVKAAGIEVVISAFYGREGTPARNQDGILELPRFKDGYGNDVIEAHYQYTKADAVVSLIDPFAMHPDVMRAFPWAAWVPVDSMPAAPENIEVLREARWVWSMSRFGHEQLQNAGFSPVYVPHGVDTTVFKPVDRAEARRNLAQMLKVNLDGKFLVVSVAANKGRPSRKNFAGMFEAFALFAEHHPDAVFYVHTEPQGRNVGEDLHHLAKAYRIADRVYFPPDYQHIMGLLPPVLQNDIYNAADVFMLLSYGEGFGIPIVEAQAAGCPVILTNGSTGPELCFSGHLVDALPVPALQGRLGCRWWMAVPGLAAQALERAYTARNAPEPRQQARDGALAYDADKVFAEHMLPALRAIERDVRGKMLVHQPRRHGKGGGKLTPGKARKRRKAKARAR